MKTRRYVGHLAVAVWLAIGHCDAADGDVFVRNADEFRQAVNQARPGTHVTAVLWQGGFYFKDLKVKPIAPSSSLPLIQLSRR